MITKQAPPGTVRSKLHPVLQELIERLGIDFCEPRFLLKRRQHPLNPMSGGFWDAMNDFICVQESVPIPEVSHNQDHFLMHELVHWTGHPRRLNRAFIANSLKLGRVLRNFRAFDTEEATAELGMVKLAKSLGIDYKKAEACAKMYVRNHPRADLHQAHADAESAVAYILEKAYGYVRTQKAA